MSSATPQTTIDPPRLTGLPGEHRRRSKTIWLVALLVVVIAAGVVVALANPFSSGGASRPGLADSADPTSLYTVAHQDLSSQTQVSATLGYADSYWVVNQAQGTLTALPSVGQVISQGQVLYQVNGAPVVLLYGSTPAYRTLSSGPRTDVTGADVAELNADLVGLGDATTNGDSRQLRRLLPRGHVHGAKEAPICVLGVTQTGTLTLGQAVFLPGRGPGDHGVGTALGAPAQAGQAIMQGNLNLTSGQHRPGCRPAVGGEGGRQGDDHLAQQPDDARRDLLCGHGRDRPPEPGRVRSNPARTITVLVTPTDPVATGTWDQAPVNVTITTGTVTQCAGRTRRRPLGPAGRWLRGGSRRHRRHTPPPRRSPWASSMTQTGWCR